MENKEVLPLISIIVPVYNVKEYVTKCLDSICGQTYKNLEIIVIDDGSNDGSGEICDKYAQSDERIKVIHRTNGGLSVARNQGLDIARGEYIGFVDSDDWIDVDMYEFLYQLLKSKDAEISICSHYVEKPDKVKIKYASNQILELTSYSAIPLLVKDKIIRNYAWDKLFKKSLFDGLRFPQDRYFEDIAIMYQLFYRAQKVVMKGCPKYHYVVRDNSITGSKYNPEKEYHMFLAVFEQNKFILDRHLWDKTPIFVIHRGIHLIDHIMLAPPSSAVERIIEDVLDRMHQYDYFSWRQIGIAYAMKRWAIYYNLPKYGIVYRFFRTVFKSKRHRF